MLFGKVSGVVLSVAVILSHFGAALAQSAATPTTDPRWLPYAEPGKKVDIGGGRHINLHCSGTGAPTVVLMAGLGSWSAAWYKVQPEIGKKTRVCAFDRASFGFSDPAPQPQILPDVVEDLHAALKAAGEPGPYVLVGHSLGGVEARLFVQRWPQDVAGLVLVDTSAAGLTLVTADVPGVDDGYPIERMTTRRLKCALLASRGEPSRPEYQDCVIPVPKDAPPAFRRVWSGFFTADYHAAQIALLSSLNTHRYDGVDHLHLGDMPVVVLSEDVSNFAEGSFGRNYGKMLYAQHEALAHLSSRGAHRIIQGAGHDIELDRPQAVIDAVKEVVRELPAGPRRSSK